jgi:hypothetical protein
MKRKEIKLVAENSFIYNAKAINGPHIYSVYAIAIIDSQAMALCQTKNAWGVVECKAINVNDLEPFGPETR